MPVRKKKPAIIHSERMDNYKIIHELGKVFGFKVPVDGIMTMAFQKPVVDITNLDKKFAYRDIDYDGENAKYKGKECSMHDYVKIKFGEEAAKKLESII